MPVLHHLVRLASAVTACALLAGPATAEPPTAPTNGAVANGSATPNGVGAAPANGPGATANGAAGEGISVALARGAAAAMANGVSPADTASAVSAIARATHTAAPSDWFAAYGQTLDGLEQLGVQPFLYPTAAPFCLGGTTLGLAPPSRAPCPDRGPSTRYPFRALTFRP